MGMVRNASPGGALACSTGHRACRRADHNIAWRVHNNLGLDYLATVPGLPSLFTGDATHPDKIIFDIAPNPNGGTGVCASGFGHPSCLNTFGSDALPAAQ
jgi:hypothetical protein